jgi:hypothetical protein
MDKEHVVPEVLLVCPKCATEQNMADVLVNTHGWVPTAQDANRWVPQWGEWLNAAIFCANRDCSQVWSLDFTETAWVELPLPSDPDADEFEQSIPRIGGVVGLCAGCEGEIFSGERHTEVCAPDNSRVWCHKTSHCLLRAGSKGFRPFPPGPLTTMK